MSAICLMDSRSAWTDWSIRNELPFSDSGADFVGHKLLESESFVGSWLNEEV